MPKIDVGVGEEFPVNDAAPPQSPPPGDPPSGRHHHRRRGFWHVALHVGARLAFIALVIAGIGWLFHATGSHYAWHGPYALAPYPHHFGFFPFFPILFLVLLLFAFRRRHHGFYGHGCRGNSMRRWHDEMHRDRGERA